MSQIIISLIPKILKDIKYIEHIYMYIWNDEIIDYVPLSIVGT